MFNFKGLDLRSALRRSLFAAVAAIPLCFVSACALDSSDEDLETETDTAAQALAGECRILRPYGWFNSTRSCSEGPIVPSGTVLILAPGQSHRFTTRIQVAGQGTGGVTVTCRTDGSGRWDESNKSCSRGPVIDP